MIRVLLFLLLPIVSAAQSIDSIIVDISDQKLYVLESRDTINVFPVSTSKYGIGSKSGSNKTPLGFHRVKKKYGFGLSAGSVLAGRVATGETAPIESRPRSTGKDYVTTRILWLEGQESGLNRGPGIDSYNRYIYIHGTHEEGLIGQPASHGCVRMLNKDVIELFKVTPVGSAVYIQE